MIFSYGYGQQQIGNNKICMEINDNFDDHVDVAVRRGLHRLLEHVHGFTWSHWMPPSRECLRRIAPAAVMLNKFVETTLNTNETQLLTSNYVRYISSASCL
jgi:hypothetical protein